MVVGKNPYLTDVRTIMSSSPSNSALVLLNVATGNESCRLG